MGRHRCASTCDAVRWKHGSWCYRTDDGKTTNIDGSAVRTSGPNCRWGFLVGPLGDGLRNDSSCILLRSGCLCGLCWPIDARECCHKLDHRRSRRGSRTIAVGGAGIFYGLRQRQLRQRNIERLTARVLQFEQQKDPHRSSSGLTPRGTTRPSDR
jgi:hypothetical protein